MCGFLLKNSSEFDIAVIVPAINMKPVSLPGCRTKCQQVGHDQ